MKASVIICTYNRSALLRDSVLSVVNQDFSPDDYEIIVVDNNSSDDTSAIMQELAVASPVVLKYLFEPRQGLSHARNCGIAAARGEVVVFTDDDIEAEKNWLKEIVSVFDSAEVACAGGPLRPVWPAKKPEWLTNSLINGLSVSEFESARELGEFKWPHYPWGANISFRKRIFDEIGFFPEDLGRIGENLLSNEEIFLCMKVEKSGKKIAFAENAIVYHKIPQARLRRQWFLHRAFSQGRSNAILDKEDSKIKYSRLDNVCQKIIRNNFPSNSSCFESRCYGREAIGYLYQHFSASDGATKGNDFRKLRVMKVVFSHLLRDKINYPGENKKTGRAKLINFPQSFFRKIIGKLSRVR